MIFSPVAAKIATVMGRNKLWIFRFLCIRIDTVISLESFSNSVDAQATSATSSATHSYNGDTLVIEATFVNSSDIQILMSNRSVLKIYVYILNTFYVDGDLKLNGIAEMQIFANTWNILRTATFDLSGLDGANQEPSTVIGAAGKQGNSGMNGGNFFGYANEIINSDFLTVNLTGGNGGDGQDGTASNDIEVTLNESEYSGDSGWFSTVDLRSYYQRYFTDRGYDPDIIHINDYTSFGALFSHDDKANLTIMLHPRKCCGTTGMGGALGLPGRSGTYVFKNNALPKFVTNVGFAGKSGKTAKACKSTALSVRIDTKLDKVMFAFFPLYHSFSSHLSIVDRLNSYKCPIKFVGSNERITPEIPHKIEIVPAIITYKAFLLKNMRNSTLNEIIQKTYDEIDSNSDINDEYTMNAFAMEANELEKHFLELRKSLDLRPLYETLSRRIKTRYSHSNFGPTSEDERNGQSLLSSILSRKIWDLEGFGLIFDMETFFDLAIDLIKDRSGRTGQNLNINDVNLRNSINQLEFNINKNYILATYNHAIDGYKLTFFPFAVEFLEMHQLSTSSTNEGDINAIVSTATNNLKSMSQRIKEIDFRNGGTVMHKNFSNNNDPEDSFYIWKNSEVRDDIRRLFSGKKVKLLADVKKSRNRFNAIKFNTIEVVFRSSNQNVNDQLKKLLESFWINLNHSGASAFRCNNNFYKINSEEILILQSFQNDENQFPTASNLVYEKLRENRPSLSPYTLWEFQLVLINERFNRFDELKPFFESVDIELHGTGEYINENASICNNSNLTKSDVKFVFTVQEEFEEK